MALGVSEIMLTIRASDMASREIRAIASTMGTMDAAALSAARTQMIKGGALVALGAGFISLGSAGLQFFSSATDAAATYEQAARLAFTQVDNGTTSLQNLEDMGIAVATKIPVALGDTQKALYTIFSTVDVNTAQSQKLLTEFSKAAVAGQTDVNTATQGTLRVMNAFKMSTDDVSTANDDLFQLVRKGVGTYDDFVAALGKSAPSAVRAGQSVQQLSGMLAFLTRNGLSASMAATSASRTLDAISNPTVQANFKAMGMSVVDAGGNFKSMTDIMSELSDKMKDMTQPEKAAALTNLFKGGGNNVQAMRFLNLVVNNDDAFNGLVGDMNNSKGSMDAAYKIMFKSPQEQVQLLTNKFQAMKVEVGQSLLPTKAKLLELGNKLMSMWLGMPKPVQKVILIFFGVASALAVVVGIVLVAAGAFIILNTAVGLLEIELLPLLGMIAMYIAAFIAVVAIIVVVIKWHKQIWDFMKKVWGDISDFVVGLWNSIASFATRIWNDIVNAISKPISDIIKWLVARWNDFASVFMDLWYQMTGPLEKAWEELTTAVHNGVAFIEKRLDDFVQGIQNTWHNAKPIIDFLSKMFSIMYNGYWKPVFGLMMDNLNNFWHMLEAIWGHVVNIFVASLPLFKAAWTFIVAMLLNAWDTIKGILEIGLKIFLAVFKAIVDVLKTFWSALVDIFGGILDIIGGTIGVIVDLLTGHWGMAWESFVKILRGAWSIVKGVLDLIAMPFIALWDLIKGGFVALGTAISEFFTFFLRTFDAIFHFAGPVIKFFLTLVKNIIGIWGDAGKWLLQAGGNIIQGLWDGIKTVWDSFIGFWKQIFQYIIDFFKNLFGIHSPSSVFSDFGISLITGLLNGITGAIGAVWDWFGKLGGWILGYFVDALTWLFDVGSKILTGLGNGIINGAIAVWDFYSGFYGKILGYFASALTWLWDVGSKLLTGLLNGVKNGAIDLGTWFGGLAGTVLGWVGDASKWLFDVGSNLLHGLSDGMESAFSWVFGKVKDFFMGLLPGWVKDLLGIHSPSTVFADFGKMTMYGFGAGINSGASVAIAAAGNAAMAVTAAFQSNMGIDTTGFSNYAAGAIAGGSDNATASAASSGGSSAGTVIMPVTINTQEINPLQHAAELGAAFANRVG